MDKIIFEAILILFPFGQLFKFGIFNLFDGVTLLFAVYTIFKKPKFPNWYKYFLYLLVYLVFILFVNYKYFEVKGLLYLVRLWSYSMIPVAILNSKLKTNDIFDKMLIVVFFVLSFGFLQYFIFPDLTSLKYFNWDDHLLRMTVTFLDPAFLGIILVLGLILALSKNKTLIACLLSFGLMFTYSRASFLSLLFVFVVDLIKYKNIKRFIFLLSSFLIILFLPRNIGEGTTLTRTVSIQNKFTDFSSSLYIIKSSPIFGVGFNNLCTAKQDILPIYTKPESHSCSGVDSSILFVLATSGIIGLFFFVKFLLSVKSNYLLNLSFVAVLIHSTFTNTLFYPHVMFWLFVLLGVNNKDNLKTKVNS